MAALSVMARCFATVHGQATSFMEAHLGNLAVGDVIEVSAELKQGESAPVVSVVPKIGNEFIHVHLVTVAEKTRRRSYEGFPPRSAYISPCSMRISAEMLPT